MSRTVRVALLLGPRSPLRGRVCPCAFQFHEGDAVMQCQSGCRTTRVLRGLCSEVALEVTQQPWLLGRGGGGESVRVKPSDATASTLTQTPGI